MTKIQKVSSDYNKNLKTQNYISYKKLNKLHLKTELRGSICIVDA